MALDEGLQGIDQSEIKSRKKNAAWQHEWRKNNPNKIREYNKKARPGITKRQREKRDRNSGQGLCRCGNIKEDEQFKTCRTCREEARAYHRRVGNYKQRERYLHTVNGVFRVPKRKYPEDGKCELNGESGKKLLYHHWDDENMRKGIWVCFQCHRFVEAIDQGWHLSLLGKYLRLKEEINNG